MIKLRIKYQTVGVVESGNGVFGLPGYNREQAYDYLAKCNDKNIVALFITRFKKNYNTTQTVIK